LPTAGRDRRSAPLVPIAGQVAPAGVRMPGCGFAPRCPHVDPVRCATGEIAVTPLGGEPEHRVQCVRAAELPPWSRRQAARSDGAGRAAAEPVVTVHDLRKVYEPRARIFGRARASVQALNGVELTAMKGRTLAIVGESGCGKSTLAKVLIGLETA